MKNLKKVSIIIPAYNSAHYLEDCLSSVRNQTYRNLEIMVIDDGSTDKTADILKAVAKKDSRICAFYNENHGVSYSRNFGIDQCSGEYIAFVDADDIVAPDFIEQLVNDLETANADMAAVGVAKEREFDAKFFKSGKTTIFEGNGALKQLFGEYEGFVCNKLYKKSLLHTKQLRMEQDISVCEDLLFNVQYLLPCAKVVYNNGRKYFYRQIESSVSNRLDNLKWFDAMKAYQRILEELEGYDDAYIVAISQYAMFLGIARYRIKFLKDYDEDLNRRIFAEWKWIRYYWKYFSAGQRLKLYILSVTPGIVVRYQRRKL